MADQVKSLMVQLKTVLSEIEELNVKSKKLKEKEKSLKTRIRDHMKNLDQEAIKYDNIVIFVKEQNKKSKLKTKEKKEAVTNALLEMGINDPQAVLSAIKEASSGELIKESCVQVKKIN